MQAERRPIAAAADEQPACFDADADADEIAAINFGLLDLELPHPDTYCPETGLRERERERESLCSQPFRSCVCVCVVFLLSACVSGRFRPPQLPRKKTLEFDDTVERKKKKENETWPPATETINGPPVQVSAGLCALLTTKKPNKRVYAE